MLISRRSITTAAVTLLCAPAVIRARAADVLRFRCSLDTAPSHGRNISIVDFLHKVEAASGGALTGEVFHSGQLFPDLQVGKALLEGQVEMACPGSWTITGIIPDSDFFQLPFLYGQPLDIVHKVIDGKAGGLLNASIQQKLRACVVGPWLDLGFFNWYSTREPLKSLADLGGLKIRNAGGAGQAWRARFLGAIPNTTAWPNVPLGLTQGTFDGLVSTDESLVTASLWEAGIKYALADHQFVGEYIPMISLAFWGRLTPAQQALMTDIWGQNISQYRALMMERQVKARATLEQHGVAYVDPTPEQTQAERLKMAAETATVVHEIKLSETMVTQVRADVGSAA